MAMNRLWNPFGVNVLSAGAGSEWPTTTLPKDLVNSYGTLMFDFESTSGWSLTYGTVAQNTTQYVTGSASLRCNDTAGGNFQAIRTTSWTFPTNQLFRLYVYAHGPTYYPTTNILYIASTADLSKTMNWNFTVKPAVARNLSGTLNWNVAQKWRDSFGVEGGDSWANTMIRMRANGAGTNPNPFSLDSLYYGCDVSPAVLITFDDGGLTDYTQAYSYMKTRHVRATSYCISDVLLGGAALTVAQAQEMYADGWCIANHSSDTTNFTTLTQAQIETKLATCQGVLQDNGMPLGAEHVAYPSGGWDTDTLNAMVATGMKTGRTYPATGSSVFYLPRSEDMLLTMHAPEILNTTTLADVKARVDSANALKAICILPFHGLVAAAPSTWQWLISDFQALVDYIISLGIPIITMNDLWALRSGAVDIPQAA